ncbi:MAG: type IV secretion system protein [Sphingomonas sp.]|uniref:virB8 family protein n=1 Tax=Sphingomonas sp. TaxID=28214 RepID=UPI001AD0753F|nr:type IV secretion system protein [Sphingomonas sp.]MBN8809649.1 type IV secretion system protein [Sphingomonas sp.]
MKQSSRDKLDNYYREAGSWADDRQDALRGSRRAAWIVAGVAVAVALCEALALLFLLPLKTVVPYTLLVDRQTGYVQELKPLDEQKLAPDTALTRSFLVQYVIARESFATPEVQSNYRKTALWSADSARADYVLQMQVSNPASPLARLPRSSVIETRVKSVSSLSSTTALVRFDTIRRDAGGQAQPPQSWVAVVTYRFSTGPLSTEDRFLNPLGFQVTRYRRDQEALTPDVIATPAPVVVATPVITSSPRPTVVARP